MAEYRHHEPCPACPSSDGLARYDDGSAYCFVCGHHIGEGGAEGKPAAHRSGFGKFLNGEARRLEARRITEDTVKKFKYIKAKHPKLGIVYAAPYYDAQGNLVAQKIRTADKDFRWIGDPDDALPFGAQLWQNSGKKLVVTEGEIDAMSVSQAQGNMYPVVSIASGAGKQTQKYIAKHREYFRGFDEVVLMFDMDDPGQEAAQVAASVIGFDKAKIAKLPLKDANDMLVANRSKELLDAMWRAQPYSPAGIVDLADLKDQIKERPREGLSWWSPALTALTYGKRLGELVAIGAGTGVGKTDFLTQDMRHMVEVHGEKIGIFALEQNPKETGTRLVGKFCETPLHIPDYWDEDVFDRTWDEWVKAGSIYMYDSFGINSWESIQSRIKFLFHAHGVKYFYLDHLTAMAAAVEDDERKGIDAIMSEMGSLVKELDIHITFVSHLATPDGTPHEEGGRVKIRHFRGSRSIGFWAHYMIGMERDQQHEDERVRHTTTVRILKDRYTGRATGEVYYIGYDHETGMLYETEAPDAAEALGFSDVSDPLTETVGSTDF